MPHTGWAKLGWNRWGVEGGSHVPCPDLWSVYTQAPLLTSKGREGAVTAACPLCWAPCWTLERGKRRGRERPTQTHTKSPVYVYDEFDRECTFLSAHTAMHTEIQLDRTGRTTDIWVRWSSYITSIKCRLFLRKYFC